MLTWKAPAKINLFLNIQGLRPDGYHELVTVMQSVSLHDVIDAKLSTSTQSIKLTTNNRVLSDSVENNLMVKAYHLFWEHTGLPPKGLDVYLNKQIPLQAGLGGGSSNGAAMLCMLNELTHNPLSHLELESLSSKLGSDVPFFVRGATALAQGRGELIQPIPCVLPSLPVLLVKPKSVNISTPDAYAFIKQQEQYKLNDVAPLVQALSQNTPQDIEPFLFNDFEAVILKQHPILAQVFQSMKTLGVNRPMLSGSGPTIFGFSQAFNLDDISQTFPSNEFDVFLCETCPQGLNATAVNTP